jgi:spore photoproduct lyase
MLNIEDFLKTINDIKYILYDKNETHKPIVKKILALEQIDKVVYESEADLQAKLKEFEEHGFDSKEILLLKEFKGRFFQMCPGTPEMICCNYRLINTGFNCFYNCAYCYLQVYLNSFGILQFSNMNDVLNELDEFIKQMDHKHIYRIGTGEYTDSLMMDSVTGISQMLIEKLAKYPNIMLELKSKSSNIEHLLHLHEKGSAVLAWSLNTDKNIKEYEEGAALLTERLRAAKKACEAGYFLAFHFDPIIIYKGWQTDYAELIKKLFQTIDHKKTVWISLGGFRYTPDFKDIMQDNFPDEKLTAEEMFPGQDGKYRYFKKIRIDIYNFIKSEIAKYTNYPFVYMCMESAEVWESVFDKQYDSSDDLEKDMANYLENKFAINI